MILTVQVDVDVKYYDHLDRDEQIELVKECIERGLDDYSIFVNNFVVTDKV